jgi:glycosyltransferase involved in cell wall biosynthesis
VLVPHGHYRTWFERMPRAAVVPGRLGYVGLIKPYKGVERLVDAFAEASAIDPALSLHVAGKPVDREVERRLEVAAERIAGLRTTLRYLSEEEFAEVITSSELVVLPYRFMHNSGAALAALSLARPVLVPDNEVNRELSAEVGPGWMHFFTGDISASALVGALRAVQAAPPRGEPDLGAREWKDAGSAHAHAYRLAIERRGRRSVEATSMEVPRG